MLFRVMTAAMCALVLLWLLWLLADILLARVGKGEKTRLIVRVEISGAEPRLEETARSLARLRAGGRLPAEIEIVDRGMDETTRRAAQLLQRDGVGQLKEYEWTRKESKASPAG